MSDPYFPDSRDKRIAELERELGDTNQLLQIEKGEYSMLSNYFEELKLRFPTMAQIMIQKNQADTIEQLTKERNDLKRENAELRRIACGPASLIENKP